MATMLRIGVIGGSGLYDIEGISNVRTEKITTPFGDPSDEYTIGEVDGVELVFLPRHGKGHRFNPSEVNYRANIFGMKKLGVDWLIAVSAVGSLKEEIVPGHIVLIDQFIDRTHRRAHTFFENGVVGHVPFAHPICETLRGYLKQACEKEEEVIIHDKGTYVNMEGPAFSTIAESHLYRSWGASVIGMTTLTEAKLAREAEISYAVLAMATDYDCWHETHESVTVEQVVATVKANVAKAKRVIKTCIPIVKAHSGELPQANALQGAIMTAPEYIPNQQKIDLAPIIGKYVGAPDS